MRADLQLIAMTDVPVDGFLALNTAHARELSLVTEARFRYLIARAFYAKAIAPAAGFLIAFDATADFDGTHFAWFRQRFGSFVYVDRVVVDKASRGSGLASALYADLTGAALRAGRTRLACEINSDPPNPASDALHARRGFRPVGTAQVVGQAKTVRYMTVDLERTDTRMR